MTYLSSTVQKMKDSQDESRKTGKMPPPDVLDRIADEKFWAGYQKSKICRTCFIAMPKTGECPNC